MKISIPEILLALRGEKREGDPQLNLNADERRDFSRGITYLNILRTRAMCPLLAAIEALAFILAYNGHMQYNAGTLSGRVIMTALAINTVAATAFFLGVRRPASPSHLQPWQSRAMIVTVMMVLSAFAVISVFREAVDSGPSPFMIALLVCAAGIYLYPGQSLLVLGIPSLVLLIALDLTGLLRLQVVFNYVAVMLFAFAVSVFTYRKERRDFKRKRLLEETNKQLIENVTERKKIEEEVRESQQQLAAIIDFLPIATIVINREGEVTAWNRAVEQITGVKATDILGKGNHEYSIPFYGERRPILINLVFASLDDLRTKYLHVRNDNGLLSAEAVCPALPGGGRHLLGFASALHDSRGNITGAIECLRDITEFRQAEAQLKEAKEIADAANQAKSVFLATMSHEIRTPMNAIIGMTGLLIDSDLSTQERDYAQTIRDSSEALLTIINDILDFSKIEAGKLDLESSPYDLRGSVESTFELLGHRASEKGLEMGYLIDPKVPARIIGDSTRVNQILTNLVSNAIKFTDKGEIIVTVVARPTNNNGHLSNGAAREIEAGENGTQKQNLQSANEYVESNFNAASMAPAVFSEKINTGRWFEIEFTVKDTGMGIPQHRMDRLFKSFSQVDSSMTRKYGGTGLGLAICRRLSEMMGGRIWAESAPGRGSTFSFTIRAEEAQVDAVQAHLSIDQPALQDRSMLIVDDNPTNRKILSLQAESWGMRSRQAAGGNEALEMIQRNEPFDIAVLDMQMPEMDGLTLAAEIRKHREAISLPLILLSSVGRIPQDPRLSHFSANLTKPVKSSKLYNVLIDTLAPKIIPVERKTPDAADSKMENFVNMSRQFPLRILVAEDNGNNQKLIRLILQRMGYLPEIAGNGKEAVASLERQPYDVVLMDVQMPEMDGLEATSRIRSQFPQERQPYIIAMTANAMQGDREQCLAAGMDDYVSKPIRVNELAAGLRNVRVRHLETGSETV